MSTERMIEALARHERAIQAVASLKTKIGEELSKCSVEAELERRWKDTGYPGELVDSKVYTKTHLWEALNERAGDGGYGERGLNAGEIVEHLADSECQHCMAAWELIQQRKDARQELGIARRLIRHYGKKALASAGKAGEV